MLGLCEDLRIFSDGLPARKGNEYFKEGPYFGVILESTSKEEIKKEEIVLNSFV